MAFFSYSRQNTEFALRLAEDLKAAGADVWLDQLDIAPGQRWARAVQEALQNSPRVLVILSPASVNSNHVEDEVNFALDEQKTVVPIFYQDCKVPFRLRPLQYVDFRTDYAHGLKILLKTLGVKQQSAPSPAATPSPRASRPTATFVEDHGEDKNEQLEKERKRVAERARLEEEQGPVAAEKARLEEEERRKQAGAEKTRLEQQSAAEKARLEQEERERQAADHARLSRETAEVAERVKQEAREKAVFQKAANYVDRPAPSSLPVQRAAVPSQQPRARALAIRSTISLAVLTLGMVSSWLRAGLSPAIPTVQRDLGLSNASVGLVFSAFSLTYYVFYLLAGYAMTKFGSRRIVAFGLLLSTLGAAWTAFATGITGLILSRVVLGAGVSVVIPARCEIFALLPEEQRALTNGLFEFCSNTMVWIVPIFSSALILAAGWRWMIGVQAIAATILGATWLVIDHSAHGRSWSAQGSLWLRNRTALGCCAVYIAYTYCTQTAVLGVPLMIRQHGFSISTLSLVSSVMFPVLGASALLSGWASDRLIGTGGEHTFKARKRFVLLGLLLATSIGGVGFAQNTRLIYVLVAICFASLGAISSNLWALLQSCAPPGDAAKCGGSKASAVAWPGHLVRC